MDGPIMRKKIEAIIKNFTTKKTTVPEGFMSEFYRIFKEELRGGLCKMAKKEGKTETSHTHAKEATTENTKTLKTTLRTGHLYLVKKRRQHREG